MASKQCKVMMFPWLAFGHMLPFLELSKQLAAKGVQVIFISTPRNIQRLPAIPSDLTDKLKLVAIPLPSVDGLPENCEATIDLQLHQVQHLKKAYDMFQVPVEDLLCKESPNLILFDFAPCWVPEIAAKFNVPSAFFSAFSAAALAFLGPPEELSSFAQRTKPEDLTVPPSWFPFPSQVAHMPSWAPMMLQTMTIPDISGKSTGQRWAGSLEGCDFVAVRSCHELEEKYLDLLQKLYKKPVLPVGVLPPKFVDNESSDPSNSNWASIFKWLDQQEAKSVVFVTFGSEYRMPTERILELAYGLELSELPFLWILRKPKGIHDSELLPNGFLARTSGRGIVSLGWAPQLKILAHPSIGSCLFHSGWGSIIETLGFGHPLILMPMMGDQGLNAKLLVEQGIGSEVRRNQDGSFNRDDVAKSMRLVMQEKEGEPLRLKAAQMPAIFANQEYMSKFVQYLVNYEKK